MQTISISKFKAACLAALEQVRRSREPILVTKRGEPVAEIKSPPHVQTKPWLGSMAGSAEIAGDIVAPAGPSDGWEMLR
jgi:prevent-host-death family protein